MALTATSAAAVTGCVAFIDYVVRANGGRFFTKAEAMRYFSNDSKDSGIRGKLYYLVSKIANQQRYVYFDRVPGVFDRYVDNYDLLAVGHDWSCLLETETVHKFCVDVDCGCSMCKNVGGHTKITPGDVDKLINKIIDHVHDRFGIDAAVLRSSYVVTTGSSHGFHVIFDRFVVDHFSYVQLLNSIVETVDTHCMVDVPSCFPLGYGRGHARAIKFTDGRPAQTVVRFDELCPYVDVTATGMEFYHFNFNVGAECPPGTVKLSDIRVKRKVAETATFKPPVVPCDISNVNVDLSALVKCTDPRAYYAECYCKFIRPFSLAGHSLFFAQVQQFHCAVSSTVGANDRGGDDDVTMAENDGGGGGGGDDDVTENLNVLPNIVYEKYITDGVEITNRTGPVFVDVMPERCTRPPMEFDEDNEENDDIADADEYKTDPLQNYDMDPTNNFINIYNLNKYTDPRVYTGHIIDRQYWTKILETYHAEHMDRSKYSMVMFGYALGVFDLSGTVVRGDANIFGIRDHDHMVNLRPDEVVCMLIVYCMIYGRQVMGIISDLCAAAEDYANKSKCKSTESACADAEFIDDIDASPMRQIDSKNKSTWNQICASTIKYAWEFMTAHEERTGKRFPRKVLVIIKFLYIYNHNTDIAMKNMMSEFTCKHAMLSNTIDASVSKYLKSENLKFDHHRPYELIRKLTGADADEGLDIIDFIVTYFWKPFEITGRVHVYNMKGYMEVSADQFATYVSENCQTRKLKSKLNTRLDRGEVKPFVQNHARQFIYNTNFENDQHGTYFRNTILGDFENTYGCVQTFLIRKYPNTCYLMGRFKPEIYNIIVDCWNGLQELDYEIKMSGIKLLFVRPIVPPVFENIPRFREMFQHNTCTLSVKDYRHILSSVDINSTRLLVLYSRYTDVNPRRLTDRVSRLFYYAYMWFTELIVVLINSGLYENSNMNIDMIMSILFGETSFEQLGLDGGDFAKDDDGVSSILTSSDYAPPAGATLPTIDFTEDHTLANQPLITFDYEQFINCSSTDYMLNVHQLAIDSVEFTRTEDDDDDVQSKRQTDGPANGTTLTELSVINNRKNTVKTGPKIINDKILQIKYNTIKIKTRKIISKIKSSSAVINSIVTSGLVDGDDSWVDGDDYKIYGRNLKLLSNHNRLLIMIVTLHALKRLYPTATTMATDNTFVHPAIQKLVSAGSGDDDGYVGTVRRDIFEWLLDLNAVHNCIWRYDFFTGPRNFSRELILYRYVMQHLHRFPHSATMVERGCSQFIDIVAHSMMYTFIICEHDFKKMIFLFKNLLNDEFPGQTIKKCLIVTGESDSGKTSFIENVYMQYISKSSPIVVTNNNNRNNAPEKISYSENFVLYQEDQTVLRSEFIKPFISKSKQSFRNNHGNSTSEVYPLPHLMLTNNDTRIVDADNATYNRIMVFSMNSIYGNCVNKFVCEYLYMTPEDRCRLYEKCKKINQDVSREKFTISTDNLSLPYLFTNFHERQYITSELDVTKIIEGWQLITMYFSWYKFFKQINNPGSIYGHSLPQSMKDDYQQWLLVVSPFTRWKKYVEIKKIASGNVGEVGMEWCVIQRNLEEFSKNVGTPSGDMCVMFKRDFIKYYNSADDTYNVKVNEIKFKNIVKTKMKL